MSESNQAAVQGEVAETSTVEVAPFKVAKQYFPSSKMAEAQVAIEAAIAVAGEHDKPVIFSFDTDKEFPTGYGISIETINRRLNNESVPVGLGIGAIPDMETIAEHKAGQEFILQAVIGKCTAKLANAMRPNKDGESAASFPFSVEDFITSNRPEGVLLAYNEFASTFVKSLKGMKIPLISTGILRQCLQSKAFAEQQYPTIADGLWSKVLDSMIKRASEKQMALGLLADWQEGRDSAELHNVEIDLSKVDFDNVGVAEEGEGLDMTTPEGTASS